jgi:DNA-binding SARP family transcriptional activator
MSTAEIYTFGSFRVVCDGRTVGVADFPSKKAKQLLAVLALARGKRVSMDHLIDSLWGAKLPKDPVSTVEQTVSVLRSFLAKQCPHPIVLTSSGGYALNSSVVDIDLDRFDQLTQAAATSSAEQALQLLKQALAIANGVVLEDEQYAEWSSNAREYYERRYNDYLLEAAKLALATDRPAEVLQFGEQAQRRSALPNEVACRLMASALADLERRTEALALLNKLERDVYAAYGIGLSRETLAVRADISSPPAPDFRNVVLEIDAAVSVTPEAGPLQFVGRAEEQERFGHLVNKVLSGGSAFAVIEGSVGMGRSALLTQLAQSCDAVRTHIFSCAESSQRFSRFSAVRLYALLENSAGRRNARLLSEGDETAAELLERLGALVNDGGPMIVFIDDLHWADPESVSILAALTEPGMATSFAIVATVQLGREIPGIRGFHPCIWPPLQPLSSYELDQVGLSHALEETGGHPGTVAAVFEACIGSGFLSSTAIGGILARCEAGGPSATLFLRAAAALEQPFSALDAARSTGVSPTLCGVIVTRLQDGGVLIPHGSGRFTFADGVTRRFFTTFGGFSPRWAEKTPLVAPLPLSHSA